MKKIKKFLFLLSLSLIITNCGDEDGYEVTESQRGPNFSTTAFNVGVPEEGLLLDIPVIVSSLSSADRVYDIVVVSSSGSSSEFSLGTAVVPANETEGVAQVSFDFDQIADPDPREVVLNLSNEGGAPSNQVTIEYFRQVICNDLEITIVSDVWASETYFSLKDASGAFIVERFFPYGGNSTSPQTFNQMFMLPDGAYSYEMGDTFGDGMVGTGGGVTLTGNYSLVCSLIVHAEGSGAFDSSVSDAHAGNPDAIVEVTAFGVNQ